MSVLWHKVAFDLWHNKSRTLLAVISIAAGLITIGGIFGLLDQLLSTMDAAHRSVQPSHVNIILRDYVDQAAVDDLKKTPGVLGIEPVNQISVRYKLHESDPEWKIGTLVERPDYTNQTYDKLELKDGNWPDELKLGVERLTSENWGVEPGGQVILEVDGKARTFDVDGLVRHPFVQPPAFGGQAVFFASAAGLAEFGVPEGRFGQLLVRVDDYSLSRAQSIAGELRQGLGDKGYGVVVTLYQDPERHWGRKFLEGVNLVLQIMAVVSLFMSVILVLNTFTALITQQTDQIGVIKAIGGQSGSIARVYLAEALVIGLLALLIALPLGAAFAFYMAKTYLRLFNIDYGAFHVSTNAVTITTAAAVVAPLLAALWPTLKGASISVRQAIATYGIGADFGSSAVDRLVERIGGRLLPPLYAASLGNLFRRKGRLALTVLVLSVAGAMFLVVMSLIASIQYTLDNDMARRGYDVKIGFVGEKAADQVRRIAEGEPGVTAVETWYSRNATILRAGERLQDSAGLGAQLTGVPPQTAMQRPLVVEGRWLAPGDGRAIVMSAETAKKNNLKVGDEVTLNLAELGEAKWTVVGLYRVVYDTGFVVEPVYAPLDAMLEATGKKNVASQVLLATADKSLAGAKAVSDALRTQYEAAGMKVDFYTSALKQEERDYASNQFSTVIGMLIGLASLVATVGGIGLAGSLSIGVVERTREIGVLRAIGAVSRTLTGLFLMEGVLQGILSWIVAVPLSFVLAQPLARLMGQVMLNIDLDFANNWAAVGVWLAVIVGIALCAASVPARNATKISVRQALAYS